VCKVRVGETVSVNPQATKRGVPKVARPRQI
jgi:hypothetical protein